MPTSKQVISGPAIVRRSRHNQWEYALLNADGTFSAFGHSAPSWVKWVYQVTWKDKLQRVVTLKDEDRWSAAEEKKQKCWWKLPTPFGEAAVAKVKEQHSKPYEAKEASR